MNESMSPIIYDTDCPPGRIYALGRETAIAIRAKLGLTDPSSAPHEYEKGCAGKEAYPSESAAIAAIKIFRKEGTLHRPSRIDAYECQFCGAWHLGNN